MKKYIYYLLFLIMPFSSYAKGKNALKLWYRQPATEWMNSTPIGNGRLGAMIFGGIGNERVALNEITMWAGEPDPHQELPCGKEKLAEIRNYFFDGKLVEGNALCNQYLSGKPNTYGTHLPVGDLIISFGHNEAQVSNYRRELDIENALTTVTYQMNGAGFRREYFCSNPDSVLMIRITSSKKRTISCDLMLNIQENTDFTYSNRQMKFYGKARSTLKVNGFPDFSKGGVEYSGIINISNTGGIVEAENNMVKISKADELILVIDIRTNYRNPDYRVLCENTIKKAISKKYAQIRDTHIKDYRNLFDRVEVDFGSTKAEDLPTDDRFFRYCNGEEDPNMAALFMQYGRYLLIAASRENSPLPANLQGLWNDNLAANMPWTCDYHLDINTQQNYWPANITNLHECNTPLFNYIGYLAEYGRKTAGVVYGSPGWVAHTVTNVWGYTAPGEWPGWGLHPTASTWLASHLWEHFLFTKDTGFLATKAYPLLKENAEFFMDYMVENPHNGYLMTGPSTSPENSFIYKEKGLSLSMMPTCDRVFVYELFNACIESANILGIDSGFKIELEKAVKKLPPFKISKNGTLQEWFEDYTPADPGHRHTTHLTALYPYSQISLRKTPGLAKAAKKTIDDKLALPGWEDVEWSRGNMVNFYARLKEPELAYNSVFILLKDLTRENLLTFSVAGIAGAQNDIFILDGNTSGAAGIAEMLIQSHEGYIEFLPALPEAWATGYYKGLCTREGAVADVVWEKSDIKKATIKASVSKQYHIKLADKKIKMLRNGKKYPAGSLKDGILTVFLDKNDKFEIIYQ